MPPRVVEGLAEEPLGSACRLPQDIEARRNLVVLAVAADHILEDHCPEERSLAEEPWVPFAARYNLVANSLAVHPFGHCRHFVPAQMNAARLDPLAQSRDAPRFDAQPYARRP